MRRILVAKEYEAVLLGLSDEEAREAAAAVAASAKELMERLGLDRAVILCGGPLQKIGTCVSRLLGAELVCLSKDSKLDMTNALIVDMLFATEVSEKREAWLATVTASGCPVLSVAIPVGVAPDTGRVEGAAVTARITVTPFAYLPGLFLHDGLDHGGEILPVGGEMETGEELFRFEETDARRLLLPRKRTAHKGDSGKALLCVGSPKYVGAGLLCARACLAAGCGILFVACPDAVRTALWRLPEAIGVSVGSDWNEDTCQSAIGAIKGMKALGIGCGVGDGDVSSLIEAALRSKLPLVLDADGLNCLSRHSELYPLLHDQVILTPHPGEMSRLTGLSVGTVLDDPISAAQKYARQWCCTVLLKCAATVVSDGRRTRFVAEGNAGLGKGGSGDVLTGIITGLLAQGVESYDAACLGSYLLGTSAERAFDLLKERMLRATNVIEALEDWNE